MNKKLSPTQLELYDFTQDVEADGDLTKHKETKKYLLSFSSWNHGVSRLNLAGIPDNILENARLFGSEVMNDFQRLFEQKPKDLNDFHYYSDETKKAVIAVLQHASDRELRLHVCEKYITDGKLHGYIDFIARKEVVNNRKRNMRHIIELKTSSDFNIKPQWIYQLAFYKQMFDGYIESPVVKANVKYEIWIYNKKTKTVKSYPVNKVILSEKYNKVEKILGDILWN